MKNRFCTRRVFFLMRMKDVLLRSFFIERFICSVIIGCMILCSSGCVRLFTRFFVDRQDINIPQMVAHLEPVLKDNKIIVTGDIVLTNSSSSSLSLHQIQLIIKGAGGDIISFSETHWNQASLAPRQSQRAPVAIALDLSTLNRDKIDVFISTAITFDKWGVRIPVKNEIASLYLNALKNVIRKPLKIKIHTRFHSDMFRNVVVSYRLGIFNPLPIDLLLQEGSVRVYTDRAGDISKSSLPEVLFKREDESVIDGTLNLDRMFSVAMLKEFSKRAPVKVEVKGRLSLPATDITMPFLIETVQEFDIAF